MTEEETLAHATAAHGMRIKACGQCQGAGRRRDPAEGPCHRCEGAGQVVHFEIVKCELADCPIPKGAP